MDIEVSNFLEMTHLRADLMRTQARIDYMQQRPFRMLVKAQLHRFIPLLHRHALRKRTRPCKPTSKEVPESDFSLKRSPQEPRLYEVVSATAPAPKVPMPPMEPIAADTRIPANHRRLLLVHAYYEQEAEHIFSLARLLNDVDIVLTTMHPHLAKRFFEVVPQAHACLLVPNIGRDILPFLHACRLLQIDGYDQFIKLHTKRSTHVNDHGAWFYESLYSFIGNARVSTALLAAIDNQNPSIYGCSRLPLSDHYANNRYWMQHMVGETLPEGFYFNPGTMFIGNGAFLRAVRDAAFWRYVFEGEHGQLDGTLAHTLERMFGYLATAQGGECETIMALIHKEQRA